MDFIGEACCLLPLAVVAFGWRMVFKSYSVLEPYIPSEVVRILLIVAWMGIYVFLTILAVLVPNGPDPVIMILAIATFWIPVIIIWILGKDSSEE